MANEFKPGNIVRSITHSSEPVAEVAAASPMKGCRCFRVSGRGMTGCPSSMVENMHATCIISSATYFLGAPLVRLLVDSSAASAVPAAQSR